MYEQTRVTDIHFEETPPSSPIHSHFDSPLSRQCQDEHTSRPLPRRRTSAVEFALNDGPNADGLGRPKSVSYETAFGGTGEITFDYLVDASGRAGLMSTK